MFKIYVNSLIREGKAINQRNLSSGFGKFIVERFKKKEEGVKTTTAKEKYLGLLIEVQQYLNKNSVALKSMYTLYETLADLKNIFVQKLNEAQGIDTFIETETGFNVTDPEGYVAIDVEGNAVKLVNRLEFSRANFNAVKDWSKPPPAPEEPTGKLKTMVFAFGRMNPPTIGHKKLVDKVVSLAKREKADYTIILSATQKAPKDPLDPEVKLAYAKKMFPNVNIQLATRELNTFFAWLASWDKKYDKIIMVAGSDRVPEYTNLTAKYQGNLYTFKIFEVASAGERDPDADGASGMSASKLRQFAENGDLRSFRKGLTSNISEKDAENLMVLVQAGMKK